MLGLGRRCTLSHGMPYIYFPLNLRQHAAEDATNRMNLREIGKFYKYNSFNAKIFQSAEFVQQIAAINSERDNHSAYNCNRLLSRVDITANTCTSTIAPTEDSIDIGNAPAAHSVGMQVRASKLFTGPQKNGYLFKHLHLQCSFAMQLCLPVACVGLG